MRNIAYCLFDKFFIFMNGIFDYLAVLILLFLTPLTSKSLYLIPFFRKYDLFVAPFVEEIFKALAIMFGSVVGISYTISFSVVEAFIYMKYSIDNSGFIHLSFIVFRIFCIGVHLSCFILQYHGFQSYKEGKKIYHWIIGFLAAYSLHLFWNMGVGKDVLEFTRIVFNFVGSSGLLLGSTL